MTRKELGRLVRQTWVEWAQEQPDPKPSWLLSWEDLDDGQREVDMRIGERLFVEGVRSVLSQRQLEHRSLTDAEWYRMTEKERLAWLDT